MRRIGIFGGSFDPIHNGHLHLAEEARCMAKLDQVLFIPTWISPFKQDSDPASCQQRLDMVRIATSSNPSFAVSDMEIRREAVSYTADTLKRCREMMGEDTRLYFITGTDTFLTIEKWYHAEEILTQYSFIIGSRPGYREEDLIDVIERVRERYGTDVLKIEIPRLEISSSDIRDSIRIGKSVRYLLPDPLLHYIERHRLYLDPAAVASLPGEEELPYDQIDHDIDEVIRGRLKATRLAHTYGVVETAVGMAEKFGADPRKARTCALFHDAFREVGNLAHGAVAADYMEEEFSIIDEDMLNAVRFHTTGRKGMTVLEKILFLADAIEPNRNYPGVDDLRAMAEYDLDKACLMSLTRTIEYVKSQGQELDPRTQEAAEDLRYTMYSGNPAEERRFHE
ncbi:MAG: nicotinate-nucleotide adenylyltransferase [Firmicutes bacterium]|nr:nicotinate-nucleotide adenylyltransferase [Bacillota bacterium]MBR6500050.1 nicotinate-nucleotide adenylyltransferase [Bacillota bacterium]